MVRTARNQQRVGGSLFPIKQQFFPKHLSVLDNSASDLAAKIRLEN